MPFTDPKKAEEFVRQELAEAENQLDQLLQQRQMLEQQIANLTNGIARWKSVLTESPDEG